MFRTLSLSLLSAAALAAPAAAQTYLPQNGLLVVEMESSGAPGDWAELTANSGYTGDSYIEWVGANQFSNPGQGVFGFNFEVPSNETGQWTLRVRNRHDHPDATEENDVWIRMDGGTWIKTFSNNSSSVGLWTWESTFEISHGNFAQASYSLGAGSHRIEFSGRSNGFKMDRFHLHRPGASGSTSTSSPVSPQRFGSVYGSSNANSTGNISVLEAVGSPDASNNNLTLTASRLPVGSLGFFINSRSTGFVANPAGSAGNLLLGGNIGRYSSQVNTVNGSGRASPTLNLNAMQTPSGTVPATAGQNWSFQFWHRDSSAAGPTSNFSRGLTVTFE